MADFIQVLRDAILLVMSQITPSWDLVQNYVTSGRTVIGIDEVGRGAWAGPVVAGATILPSGIEIPGLNDSKLVSPKKRVELDRQIRTVALAFGIGWVSPFEVDQNGLSWAIAESGRRAIEKIWTPDSMVILDGKWNYLSDSHDAEALVKADNLVTPVAAGSIIAKVARDNYMAEMDRLHPGYGFMQHVGYGTKHHKDALSNLGPSPIHRMSYKPLQASLVA